MYLSNYFLYTLRPLKKPFSARETISQIPRIICGILTMHVYDRKGGQSTARISEMDMETFSTTHGKISACLQQILEI